jgi:hypothetical protein
MTKTANIEIDDIMKSIREAIVEKEQKEYFEKNMPRESLPKKSPLEDEVFELSKNMLVNREDIPYQLGVWSFDDVAKKMMKKYSSFFSVREPVKEEDRVSVKDDNKA